jgi:IS5 family transposase
MLKANYYTEPSEIDKLVFEKLVVADHYLRRVKEVINFESLRELIKDCYSSHMGRGAEDPVMMIKLEFLEFQYNLSDREVIAQAGVNVAFRYFLDLSLESQLPVPSLLSQFRTRLGEQRHKDLFEQIIRQAREQGLIKDRVRLKDATHVVANVAIPFTIQLIAQARERLLNSLTLYAALEVEQHKAKVAQIRIVTSDLKDSERLLHRLSHLRQIVAWAESLSPQIEPEGRPDFDEALAVAKKIVADRETGKTDKMRSVVDKDVRQGKHGSYYDGYMLDILVDPESEIITTLDILPANADEAANAEKLIEDEEKAHGNAIAELSMDKIGFNGEVLHTLTNPKGLALQVYVPPFQNPSKGDYFKPSDFHIDQSWQILSCPAGQLSSKSHIGSRGHSRVFTFSRRQCANCPLLNQCMDEMPKSGGRRVDKNYYESDYEAARERAKTERYAEVKKLHPRVERKFADIVCNHGGRRARYRGIKKVKVQFLITAMVVNIKRMVRLLSLSLSLSNKLGQPSLFFFNFIRCLNFTLLLELTF